MNKDQAIAYCHAHKNQFLTESYAIGEDGQRQFDCIVGLLKDGIIHPSEIFEYGIPTEPCRAA